MKRDNKKSRINIEKKKKKKWGQYLSILTEQAWSVKDLLHGIQDTIFLRDPSGNPERSWSWAPFCSHG